MLSLGAVKYGMAAAALVVSALGLLSAEWFSVFPRVAALLNCFTGGIIISTALVHLLAEA